MKLRQVKITPQAGSVCGPGVEGGVKVAGDLMEVESGEAERMIRAGLAVAWPPPAPAFGAAGLGAAAKKS